MFVRISGFLPLTTYFLLFHGIHKPGAIIAGPPWSENNRKTPQKLQRIPHSGQFRSHIPEDLLESGFGKAQESQ